MHLAIQLKKEVVLFNFKTFELSWEPGLGLRAILNELH